LGRATLCLLALGLAAGAAACGDDGPDLVAPVVGPSVPVPVAQVIAVDFAYEPRRLVIDAGTEVKFVNVGRNDHDVVPEGGGGWGVGTDAFGPQASHTAVFDQPGEYPYVCSIHLAQQMTGVIVVRP